MPILIVKKPEEGFQVCVDYCAFNALTIKNWNTFSLIRKIFAYFSLAKIYSKFVIIIAFNEIYIRDKNEKKTAFNTRYRLYKYIMILFSLLNTLKTFQSYINKTL